MVNFVQNGQPVSFCLPMAMTSIFKQKVLDGTIDPNALSKQSSLDRRKLFTDLFGEDNAREINASFETKLLLANQKKGILDWLRQMSGLKPDIQLSAEDQILKMDRILNPATEKAFLQDLAKKKVGADLSMDQAKEIFSKAQEVSSLKTSWLNDLDNYKKREDYGLGVISLGELVQSMKPDPRSFGDYLKDIWTIPQTLETGVLHLSAPGVQGWGMATEKEFYTGVVQMARYFADQENYDKFRAYMLTHPDYDIIRSSNLGLTNLGKDLNTREEGILSSLIVEGNKWLGDKTGFPINILGASSRGFSGYLNYVRFNTMAKQLAAARLLGEDVQRGSKFVNDVADSINDFSGRSSLGKNDRFRNFGPILNIGMFAIRKVISDVEMLNPWRYIDPSVSSSVRLTRARRLLGSVAITGAILGAARLMGAKVSFNPTDQHFAQVGIPHTDGQATYLSVGPAWLPRLLARIVWSSMTTGSGKLIDLNADGYNTPTPGSLVLQELRNKSSASAGIITDALLHKDAIGNEFSLTDELRHRFTPIVADSILGVYNNYPRDSAAVIPSLSAFLGVRVQNPLPPLSKTGLTAFGDKDAWTHDPVRNDIDREMFRLTGKYMGFPGKTMSGVKLTDSQYHEYVLNSGSFSKELMNSDMESPEWSSMSDADRKQRFKEDIQDARDKATTILQLKYPQILVDIDKLQDQKDAE